MQDISDIIKKRLKDCGTLACTVFHDERGIHITAIDTYDHTDIASFDTDKPLSKDILSANPFKSKHYVSANTLSLVEDLLFPKLDTPKENHPHGWYRKFEKKRF